MGWFNLPLQIGLGIALGGAMTKTLAVLASLVR